MGRGAWQATVHRVTKSQTRLKQLSTYMSLLENNIRDALGVMEKRCPSVEVWDEMFPNKLI